MDLDRLSRGEKIAAVSAILLFVFMFFDWFGVKVSGAGGFGGSVPGAAGNAWDALDVIPIFLVIAIAAALGVAMVRLIEADFEPAVSLNAVVAALGILAALLVLFRVIDPPTFASYAGVSVEATRKFGLFLGLIAAAGIAYGGYRAMQEEGTSFADEASRLSAGRSAGPGGSAPPPPPPPSSTVPPPPPPSN
ncbi:MAG TPA: hypothetical protein VFP23_10790 [Solirubrobacterales bacterium]|nr:hypothetical protein [Solirubrobacterales bacterium]